ncbi:MAG: DUF1127 domain-containing protein [Alphaproteobacteria bacterium]
MSFTSLGIISAFVAPAAATNVKLPTRSQAGYSGGFPFKAMVLKMAAIWRGYQAMRRLSRLDYQMLADIGLSKADIDRAGLLPLTADPTASLQAWTNERRKAQRDLVHEADRAASSVAHAH